MRIRIKTKSSISNSNFEAVERFVTELVYPSDAVVVHPLSDVERLQPQDVPVIQDASQCFILHPVNIRCDPAPDVHLPINFRLKFIV